VNFLKFDNDTLFLKQDIATTFFRCDSISFVKKTGLQIPQKNLEEIMNNSREINKDNKWKQDELNDKVIMISGTNDRTLITIKPFIKCLSSKQLDSVSKYSPTVSVYSISKLIFDENHQTAIFQLNYGRAERSFSFESVLISKVFGKWIIIRRFDWMIS